MAGEDLDDRKGWEPGFDHVPSVPSLQVLIELESALLDDQPHWYKLQRHDVSSLPLPRASPYLQRRGLQPESSPTSRRLQSESTDALALACLSSVHRVLIYSAFLFIFPIMPCQSLALIITQVKTAVC